MTTLHIGYYHYNDICKKCFYVILDSNAQFYKIMNLLKINIRNN